MKFTQFVEATYKGKKASLNKPMKGDVKKSKVYVDPDYHAKVHQDLQWHASRNRGNSTGAANYHHLITLDDPSHIENYYEKTVHPILKKHNYPTPPEGPGDGGNPKYHAAVQEIIKNWRNEPRWMHNEETEVKEATYQGREVPIGKPMKGDVKKSKVYVDPDGDGKAQKVNFGDKNLSIKKNIPARRKSFRARHNCDNPGPKTKARYWSCKAW